MKLLEITPSTRKDKKLMAVFDNNKKVHFGGKGYMDYTLYSNQDEDIAESKKAAYIARHSVKESWDDPMKPSTLSRFILWNKPTLKESIEDYKRRFDL